jgi:hypothetical protein
MVVARVAGEIPVACHGRCDGLAENRRNLRVRRIGQHDSDASAAGPVRTS